MPFAGARRAVQPKPNQLTQLHATGGRVASAAISIVFRERREAVRIGHACTA
jgi:hypothetical protein